MPDPQSMPSTDKYALDSALAYGYAKMYSDMIGFLRNQEAILSQLVTQEHDAATDPE